MSTVIATELVCQTCGELMDDGVCLNVNCSSAAATATETATRKTAKATTAAARELPRAFRSNGGVD